MSEKVRIRSFNELPLSSHKRPHADYWIISKNENKAIVLQTLKPHQGSKGHYHPVPETFIIVKGVLTFIWSSDDASLSIEKVPARSVIYVAPNTFHAVKNETDEVVETVLLIDKNYREKDVVQVKPIEEYHKD